MMWSFILTLIIRTRKINFTYIQVYIQSYTPNSESIKAISKIKKPKSWVVEILQLQDSYIVFIYLIVYEKKRISCCLLLNLYTNITVLVFCFWLSKVSCKPIIDHKIYGPTSLEDFQCMVCVLVIGTMLLLICC